MNTKLSFVITAAVLMAFVATGIVSASAYADPPTPTPTPTPSPTPTNTQTNTQGTNDFNNQQFQSTFAGNGFTCC